LRGIDQDVSDVQRGERGQMPWCRRGDQTPSALRLRLRTQLNTTTTALTAPTTSRTRRVSGLATATANVSGPDAPDIATRLSAVAREPLSARFVVVGPRLLPS
jgi:hypothetical protein